MKICGIHYASSKRHRYTDTYSLKRLYYKRTQMSTDNLTFYTCFHLFLLYIICITNLSKRQKSISVKLISVFYFFEKIFRSNPLQRFSLIIISCSAKSGANKVYIILTFVTRKVFNNRKTEHTQ